VGDASDKTLGMHGAFDHIRLKATVVLGRPE
jgi:hypothetical protein